MIDRMDNPQAQTSTPPPQVVSNERQQQQLHPVSIANGLFAQSHVTSMPIQTKVPLLRTPRMITKVGNVNPISIATI